MGGSEPIAQDGDERDIGGGHGVIAHVARVHPFQNLAFARVRDTLPFAAGKKWHEQVEILVAVRGEGERRQAGIPRVDAQFLVQFADEGVLGGFAVFNLAYYILSEIL